MLQQIKSTLEHLPGPVQSAAKWLYHRKQHPAHPDLKGTGTIQDLYFWVSDGNLDTLVLSQNYFSVIYPMLDTNTKGTVTLFDHQGRELGVKGFDLAPFACAKMKVSNLLSEMGVTPERSIGTLECHLRVPAAVMEEAGDIYFFDRFYMGYTNANGQPTFVHSVDRTYIYREDRPKTTLWYGKQKSYNWFPEIPVIMSDYERFSVIMLNRTNRPAQIGLTVTDQDDRSKQWETSVPPRGAHRFELTAASTEGLSPQELRLWIKGMPSLRGRPIVFKEFANGAISVMHC